MADTDAEAGRTDDHLEGRTPDRSTDVDGSAPSGRDPRRSRFGRSPLLIALGAGVASLLIAFAPTLWQVFVSPPPPGAPALGTPWQVETTAPGASRVFGLDLPGSTLAQARTRWGEDLSAALIAGRDGPLALEAYVERFDAGGIGGKLLLVYEAPADTLARWRDALPAAPIESGRRHALSPAAEADLASARLVGLSFIPAAQLDAGILQARFGTPAERIASDARLEHWLYPARGLAIALDAQGREVLQYVAPAEFERRLVAPLRAVSAPASASAPSPATSPATSPAVPTPSR